MNDIFLYLKTIRGRNGRARESGKFEIFRLCFNCTSQKICNEMQF